MNKFPEIKKNFGFGCMRLPMKRGRIDIETFSKMTDAFIEAGFNYFDTAKGYMDGKSEGALKKALTSRYPRDKFVLTDKLSTQCFKKESDIPALFEAQLRDCGVDYFDFYLMHAQDKSIYEKYTETHAYEWAARFKREGKVKHIGISFHDKADVLDRILTEHPEIEVVQIQFNYIDFDDPAVESGKCYEVCRKHSKPVIVMEPVKGGSLAKVPEKAAKLFAAAGDASPASYAIRFAAGFEGVEMVLSGMSDMAMMLDNISYMRDFRALDEKEREVVEKAKEIIKGLHTIPCTACRYCTAHCPKKISIPDLFACMNAKTAFHDWNSNYYYNLHTMSGGKAGDCIGCGACERICPQHLEIRKLLKQVSKTFD